MLVAHLRGLAAYDHHDCAVAVALAGEDDRGAAVLGVAGLESVHLALALRVDDLLLVHAQDVVVVEELDRLPLLVHDSLHRVRLSARPAVYLVVLHERTVAALDLASGVARRRVLGEQDGGVVRAVDEHHEE